MIFKLMKKNDFIIILILLLSIFIFNFNCKNKTKNIGYIKTKDINIVKIDYSKNIENNSNNEINLSFPEFPHTLNPFRAVTNCELFFKKSLFSCLFYIDPKTGLPEKNLISEFTDSNDDLVFYFTLKDNIKFNNGVKLDSEDVIASLSLLNTVLKDTEIYKSFFILNKELKFESTSSNDFIISSDVPNGNLLYALSNYPIIPKEIANRISQNIEDFINNWEIKIDMNIIGSGPYQIEKIEEDKIILNKNQYYFKKDKKNNTLPYTNRITVKFYNDKKSEILGFINNETNIISIEQDDFDTLKKYFDQNKNEKVRFVETNFSKNKILLAYNSYNMNSKSYLMDNEFRKYISYFIKESVKSEKEKSKYNYISINKDLFKDTNHDNILEYKDGSTIFLRIIAIEEEKEIIKIAEKVKKILEELNFDVYLEVVPLYIFLEKMFISFDYDISIFYYDFEPGIISYYKLLNKDELSFYPYIFDNNVSSEKILNRIEKCIYTVSSKNQVEEIKKLQNILDDINQLFPIFIENEFYLIKENIYNLKINSSLEDGYNLNTIETLFKSP